jgi:hypothetical protein
MIHNISRNIWIAAAATGGIALVGYLGYKLVRVLLEKGGCIGKTDALAKDKLKEKPEKPLKGDKPKISDGLENEEAEKAKKIADEALRLNEAIKKQVAEYGTLTSGAVKEPFITPLSQSHPEWVHNLSETIRTRDPQKVIQLDQSSLSPVRRNLNEKLMGYFSTLVQENRWDSVIDVIHLYFYGENKTHESLRELLENAPDAVKIELSYHLQCEDALLLLKSCKETDVQQEILEVIKEEFKVLIKERNHKEAFKLLLVNQSILDFKALIIEVVKVANENSDEAFVEELKQKYYQANNLNFEGLEESVLLEFLNEALDDFDAHNVYALMSKTNGFNKVQLLKALNLFIDSKMPAAVVYFTTTSSLMDGASKELYLSSASRIYIEQGKLDEALKLKSYLSPVKSEDLETVIDQYLGNLVDKALKDMTLAKDVIRSILQLDVVNYAPFLAWVKQVEDSPENKVLFLKSALAKTPVDEADRQSLLDYIATLEKK